MAHFAKLSVDNVVIDVVVVADEKTTNSQGIEDELVGIEYLKKITGWSLWKKTSYNTRGNKYYNLDGTVAPQELQHKAYRGNYAGINQIYREDLDVFISPQPYASWKLNTNNMSWEAPVPKPAPIIEANGYVSEYKWNENILNWVQ
jgi:hypothetical protein